MANNRLYLYCKICKEKELPDSEVKIMIAKYYPSTGWYLWSHENESSSERIDAFFEKHRHVTLLGTFLGTYLETENES